MGRQGQFPEPGTELARIRTPVRRRMGSHQSASARPEGSPRRGISFGSVSSKAELIAWELAWAGEEVNAAAISEPRLFMPRLLADTNVVFVSIQGDGAIIGGGIINRGAEVVGLSNLFGSAIDVVWRSLVATAGKIFPGLSLVGYERGDNLVAAHRAGFATVGLLRVWTLPARAL